MKNHILKTYKKIHDRNWDILYWAIDIHETCIKPTYNHEVLATEFYPLAKETLVRLSNRDDCCLILFTCSHEKEIGEYLEFFKSHDVHFKYVNENPEASDTKVGCFDKKFYTNIYLEDKAGFDPYRHWAEINNALDIIDSIKATKILV